MSSSHKLYKPDEALPADDHPVVGLYGMDEVEVLHNDTMGWHDAEGNPQPEPSFWYFREESEEIVEPFVAG